MLVAATDPTEDRSVAQIVVLKIWKDHRPAKNGTALKEVEFCEYAKKGGGGMTNVMSISRIKEAPHIWAAIEPAYNAWLKGQEPPMDGIPLDAWPGLTGGQIDHFRLLNVRSVEDVAAADESTLERMGMGARAIRDRARQYIAASTSGTAQLAAAMAEKDAQIGSLEGTVAGMKQAIEELKAIVAADKPKRGRPRKTPDLDVETKERSDFGSMMETGARVKEAET